MRVLNLHDEQVVLKKGVKLAKMESIEENCTVRVSAIGTKCKLSQKDQLTNWNMVLASVMLKRSSCIYSSQNILTCCLSAAVDWAAHQ